MHDEAKKLLVRNQQTIVKKIFVRNGVTFFYLLSLTSHNIQKLKTMAKAKKAAKKATKKKATKKKATKKAAKKKKK